MTNEEVIEYFKNTSYNADDEEFIAYEVAMLAIEKQIPKKPYDINTDCRTFDCPSCLSSLYAEGELENVGYCCVCGQALDWSEA